MVIHIRRRELIATLSGAATWSLVARAQQPYRVYEIGVLMDISQDDRVGQQYVSAFLHGLRELSWKAGDNIRIDYRWGAADVRRTQNGASELVNLKPDVILAQGSLAVSALIRVTRTIPIVFVQVGDPVGRAPARGGPDLRRYRHPEGEIDEPVINLHLRNAGHDTMLYARGRRSDMFGRGYRRACKSGRSAHSPA